MELFDTIEGNYDGYSTIKYIVDTYNISNSEWINAAKTHPDWMCIPVYARIEPENSEDYWIVRFMFGGKNGQLCPIGVCPTDLNLSLCAITLKTKNYSDIANLYQFKNYNKK